MTNKSYLNELKSFASCKLSGRHLLWVSGSRKVLNEPKIPSTPNIKNGINFQCRSP